MSGPIYIEADESPGEPEHRHASRTVVIVLIMLAAFVFVQGYVQQRAIDREHRCLTRHETLQVQRNIEQSEALIRLLTRARDEHVSIGADPKAQGLVDEYVATITKVNDQRRREAACAAP